jgi:hypothetical protein
MGLPRLEVGHEHAFRVFQVSVRILHAQSLAPFSYDSSAAGLADHLKLFKPARRAIPRALARLSGSCGFSGVECRDSIVPLQHRKMSGF